MNFRDSKPNALIFTFFAVVAAFLITRLVQAPTFTDAYYHLNAAHRLVGGAGLTDPYLWVYIGAPERFMLGQSVPSHTYWMPLTSLIAALGMGLLNAPGDYPAAQLPFTLMLAGTGIVGYWLGGKLGGSRRTAWMGGILTLASPFFLRWWGTIDTFAPYALFGSLALVGIGLGIERRGLGWFAFAGATSGLCHLTRADGLLMALVGVLVIFWDIVFRRTQTARTFSSGWLWQHVRWLAALIGVYSLVMLPWFARNLNAVGSPLPLGGSQAIWFREYNDLFSYPADIGPGDLFADGLNTFLSSRGTALLNNLQTFVAVEGAIVITPLMLIGLWRWRKSAFVRGFWLAALGIHLVMTFVFPFPGYRGGLFHSTAALLPWWMALGAAGLDAAVEWASQRLPHWNPSTARRRFSFLLVGGTVLLSVIFVLQRGAARPSTPALYAALQSALPANARVMINDPAALYYYTGFTGVVQPNETPATILEIAERYNVTHLLIEDVLMLEDGKLGAAAPIPLLGILTHPPDFLIPIVDFPIASARLYEIRR